MSRIITLITDFGIKDYAVSAIKGSIYTDLKDECRIVDISHHIDPFNIAECAYVLKNSYRYFPQKSVHIIGVDSALSPEQKHVVVSYKGHYFIGADNGVISLLIEKNTTPENIIRITHDKKTTFYALHVFSKVAVHIVQGGELSTIGEPMESLKEARMPLPFSDASGTKLYGHVVYIDNCYSNVVTNITRSTFENFRHNRDYRVSVMGYTFKKIYNTYDEGIDFSVDKSIREEEGKSMLVFDSNENLEILIYKSNRHTVGGASGLLGITYKTPIIINFY